MDPMMAMMLAQILPQLMSQFGGGGEGEKKKQDASPFGGMDAMWPFLIPAMGAGVGQGGQLSEAAAMGPRAEALPPVAGNMGAGLPQWNAAMTSGAAGGGEIPMYNAAPMIEEAPLPMDTSPASSAGGGAMPNATVQQLQHWGGLVGDKVREAGRNAVSKEVWGGNNLPFALQGLGLGLATGPKLAAAKWGEVPELLAPLAMNVGKLEGQRQVWNRQLAGDERTQAREDRAAKMDERRMGLLAMQEQAARAKAERGPDEPIETMRIDELAAIVQGPNANLYTPEYQAKAYAELAKRLPGFKIPERFRTLYPAPAPPAGSAAAPAASAGTPPAFGGVPGQARK